MAEAGGAEEALLCEFFAAAAQLILHARRVYPPELFERRRLFDVVVVRSRHPELNDYVDLSVRGVRELLRRGEADAMVVAILAPPAAGAADPQPVVLERFRFELAVTPRRRPPAADADADALRAQLRGFLLKLHFCDTLLGPLPPAAGELSFRIEAHSQPARCAEPLPRELGAQWEECHAPREGEGAAGGGGGAITPLKSMSTDGYSLQLFVQAGARGG